MSVEVAQPEIEITESAQSRTDLRLRYFCYAALVIVLVIFALVRIRLRNMPLERDEGEYAYAGQLMLQGEPPYHLAYNMKLPGTYAAYAVMMAAFGQTVAGIRMGMLIVLIGNTLLIFLLGRRLFGILAGTVAAAFYTILANRLWTLSLGGHATHFIVLMALAGTLLLLHAISTQRTSVLFGGGLCFGLAFLMKQHGILFAIFGFLFWVWTEWAQGDNWRRVISQGGILATGMILPYLLTCFVAWHEGVFEQFWFWTVSYGAQYEKLVKYSDAWWTLKLSMHRLPLPQNIWLTAGFGLTAVFWNRRAREQKVFILSFLLFSILAVCPGLYFRPHYFLVMLPAVSLLSGLGIGAAYEYLQERNALSKVAAIPIALFVLMYISALREQKKYLFKMDPLNVNREMYGWDGFPEAMAVGDYVRDHTSASDRIAVFGSEPEIYFYSHRRSATGYIYMYPLMENQKFALRMQSEMMHEIENAPPKIVVFDDGPSWGLKPGWDASEPHMNLFTWIRGYLDAHYDLIAEVPFEGSSFHLWGAPCRYYIFQRK
jgi:hypothetical protein